MLRNSCLPKRQRKRNIIRMIGIIVFLLLILALGIVLGLDPINRIR